MDFAKLHALGNDFLVLRISEESCRQDLGALSREICRRRTGIGADGAVYYLPTAGDREADYSALIFNADGSRAEISGNGIRCLAALLLHSGCHTSDEVRVRTVSGVRQLSLLERGGLRFRFRCGMGVPITIPSKIPATLGDAAGPVLDFPMKVGQEEVAVSLCSMGNPHCSTFWPSAADAPVERLGSALERDPVFPNRTNVEFIEVTDPSRLRVRFWERGVGVTPASGSGSCAAVVAAILRGVARSPVVVETAAGELEVEWDGRSEVLLTGDAHYICAGALPDREAC
jgi:diaminopimelate epimerase